MLKKIKEKTCFVVKFELINISKCCIIDDKNDQNLRCTTTATATHDATTIAPAHTKAAFFLNAALHCLADSLKEKKIKLRSNKLIFELIIKLTLLPVLKISVFKSYLFKFLKW